MEGGANGATGLMAFGENSNGLCSMMTMMHGMSTHHPPHLNSNAETNSPFLLLPSSTANNHDQNRNSSSGSSFMVEDRQNNSSWCYFMDSHNNTENNSSSDVRAKIVAHPHYHRLLAAYLNCQKVGAPPEVVVKLEEACASVGSMGHAGTGCLGEDPALDQFMEAYCEMLTKYEQELTKPFKEAMLFLQRIECQFKALTVSSDNGCEGGERNGSSEEEVDANNQGIDPLAEERELKGQLLRRYSGYLGSLKQEFMKKRKKGKLPKEARQQLLDWWSRHHKWPYPSESQKLALAESTGLDQKQINNWFINQRKRHWKPSEEMQFVVMDAAHPHPHPHPHAQYFMDSALGNPFALDITPALL